MKKIIARPLKEFIHHRNYLLDEKSLVLREEDQVPWGLKPVFLVIMAYFLAIAVTYGARFLISTLVFKDHELPEIFSPLSSIFAITVMGLITVIVVKPISHRNGGWARTFGVTKFSVKYLKYGFYGWIAVIVMRGVITLVFISLHSNAAELGSNIEPISKSIPVFVLTFLGTVLITPCIEEFMVRGVMLRTLMHKYGFWLSACISSAIFALFHLYQVESLLGALVLFTQIFVPSLLMCWLNRVTDSLIPGIIVHFMNNALGIIGATF
ncbi:MAG: CPBP family intramembrane metalloprotease [Micrococcaceae bacterium]